MFIIGAHLVCITRRKVVTGIGLLGLAAFLLGLGLLFYMSYSDMAEKISRGELSGCDHCPLAMELWFNNARFCGIVGSVLGGIGAWFTLTGMKSESIEAVKR